MKNTFIAFLFLLVWVASPIAKAEEITFEFTASLSTVNDTNGLTGLSTGDVVTGSYTFESTTPGATNTTNGIYGYALTDITLQLGAVEIELFDYDLWGYSDIQVIDDPALSYEAYQVFAGITSNYGCPFPDPFITDNFTIFMELLGNQLDGVGLPTSPPDVSSSFSFFDLRQELCDSSVQYLGSLQIAGNVLEIRSLTLSPEEQLEDLTELVLEINIAAGISNSLDSKLDSALNALDDTNENNDGAALNSMYAFCNSVEAQRDKKLTDEQADQLIDAANSVIAALDEFAPLCE